MSKLSGKSPGSMLLQRPQGLLRFVLRIPIWLYRLHLGWLLGQRFLLLTHIGRNSGKTRQTVIEVVKHDQQSDSYFVVSGWGKKADWYRNIHKNPDVVINVGRRKLQVRAEDVSFPEAIDILEEYARCYPLAFRELTGLFLGERLKPDRDSGQRLAELMPMIAFRPRP
ncbi:MAG: nitroreductase family deazaflavin-dependent oxidoreductase [Anaerolineae bacterium]